jgi:lactoylglutathione lyase
LKEFFGRRDIDLHHFDCYCFVAKCNFSLPRGKWGTVKFLHSMIRVYDLKAALKFFCDDLGLTEVRRKEVQAGRFTLVFLATDDGEPEIELTYNWDQQEPYAVGRNFGHVAFQVDDIYQTCQRLEERGVAILRPPRDGYMAFIRSPDQISVELLQKGAPLPPSAVWMDRPNQGEW